MNSLKGIFPEPPPPARRNFIKENMIQLKRMQGMGDTSSLPSKTKSITHDSGFNHQRAMRLLQSTKRDIEQLERLNISDKITQPNMKNTTKPPRRKSHNNMRGSQIQTAVQYVDETMRKRRETGIQTENYRNIHELYEKGTIMYPSKKVMKQFSPKGRRSPFLNEHRSRRDTMISDGGSSTPPSPKRDEKKDFVKENAQVVKNANFRHGYDLDPTKPPPNYQKGVIPKYLKERRAELDHNTRGNEGEEKCPDGHVILPENERRETLRMLRQSYAELVNELNVLPVRSDTLKIRNRKMEIESQLKKLDEGIKVFTRPRVYVKIGA